MVWTTVACRFGSCSTEFTGSAKYQRHEKPCQTLCDLPLLNENSTASATGTSDQTRYSQVNPSRNHGCRHGLRRGRNRPRAVRDGAAPAAWPAAAWVFAAVVMPPPVTSDWSPR